MFVLVMKCHFFTFFFFQAEDGIRDLTVTGVQTCALPICCRPGTRKVRASWRARHPRSVDPSTALRRSRSEEHTSELQSQSNLVCRLLLEKKKIDHPQAAFMLLVRIGAERAVPRRRAGGPF